MEIFLPTRHFWSAAVAMFCAFWQIRQLSQTQNNLYFKNSLPLFAVESHLEGENSRKPKKIGNFDKKLKICGDCRRHRWWLFWGLTIFSGQYIPEPSAKLWLRPISSQKRGLRASKSPKNGQKKQVSLWSLLEPNGGQKWTKFIGNLSIYILLSPTNALLGCFEHP